MAPGLTHVKQILSSESQGPICEVAGSVDSPDAGGRAGAVLGMAHVHLVRFSQWRWRRFAMSELRTPLFIRFYVHFQG